MILALRTLTELRPWVIICISFLLLSGKLCGKGYLYGKPAEATTQFGLYACLYLIL
jgi:hypothetical protein